MSRTLALSLAGFQLIIIGRFWVITEAQGRFVWRIRSGEDQKRLTFRTRQDSTQITGLPEKRDQSRFRAVIVEVKIHSAGL
jgi:hypothetical protein